MPATQTKLETAHTIARWHYDVEPEMRQIYLLEPVDEDNPREPIKLLEVLEGAIERGIEPVSFPANPGLGIPFSSMIVEVSPSEFKRIDPANIAFRDYKWKLGQELPR